MEEPEMALLVGCPACDRLAMTDTDTLFVAPAFVCEGCEVATSVRRLAASDPTIAMLLAVWRERQALVTRRSGRPTLWPLRPPLSARKTPTYQS
jgi:hypothetical protein